jgi:hypothetical protein
MDEGHGLCAQNDIGFPLFGVHVLCDDLLVHETLLIRPQAILRVWVHHHKGEGMSQDDQHRAPVVFSAPQKKGSFISPRDGPRNRVHTVIKSAASVSIQIQYRNWRILISVFRVLTLNRPTVSPTATAAPLTTAASLNPPNLNQIYNCPGAETRNVSHQHRGNQATREHGGLNALIPATIKALIHDMQ